MQDSTTGPKRRRWRGQAWRGEFAAGLAALLASAPFSPPAKPEHATASDALRSDWERIGADFRTVIDRGLEADNGPKQPAPRE